MIRTPREAKEHAQLVAAYGDRVIDNPRKEGAVQVGDTVLSRCIDTGETAGVVLKIKGDKLTVRERYDCAPGPPRFSRLVEIRRSSIVHAVRGNNEKEI